ncbi:MAG: hypothetical protein ACM33T_12025 [Solirubrobacterales bacterium]
MAGPSKKGATGIRDIDAGNEGLAFLMERVFDPLVECRRRTGACDHCNCTKIGAVIKFVGRNFLREEDLMRSAAYPSAGDHVRDHYRLVEELKSMQAARVCGDRDRARVREFILRWSKHHQHGSDLPLGLWAASRGVCGED